MSTIDLIQNVEVNTLHYNIVIHVCDFIYQQVAHGGNSDILAAAQP